MGTTVHVIGGLTIHETFDILHHRHQGQAPRCDFNGTPATAREIGKEGIVIERAKLRPQVHIEIAFGESGFHHGYRGLGNRWERMRTPSHISPPCRTTTAGLRAMEGEYNPWRRPLRI